ncbi:MAG: ABC transporter permease [Clostridia bacterium]|nr:ABC transporter permease [Clostridia bacterium]
MSLFKRTLKNAFRTVLLGWREYAGFFLALLVVQSIFWSLTFSLDTNNAVAKERVTESYSYHVVLPALTPTQTATFKNMLNGQAAIDDSFYEVEIIEGAESSEAHVMLKGRDISRSFAKFRDRCMLGSWQYEFTPLYTYQTEYVTPGVWRYAAICLAMLALCAAVLTVLYIIRMENHQFQYGIYMTCGADFRMLFRVTFWELAAIAALTFVPACLLSALIMLPVYLPGGVLFRFGWAAPFKVLGLTAATVLLSVVLPVRYMARKTPMTLITSRNNAGLVTSPRRSFHLFGKRFPRDYELAGMWRMRKYYIRLVCSAVAFASLFISGLYIADMIKTKQELAVDEFVLAYNQLPDEVVLDEEGNEIRPYYDETTADAINDDVQFMSEAIRAMDGVAYVTAQEQERADNLLGHMLLKSENVLAYGEYAVQSAGERAGYGFATNSYKYTAVDQTWIDNALASGLYTFEGDPYAVLENPNAIIVSEKILGAQRFDFKVGDTVYFASYVSGLIADNRMFTRRDQILLQQLEYFTFDYGTTGTSTGEYVVCAVITESPSDSYLTVGMHAEPFRALTALDGARDNMTVYFADGLTLAEADALSEQIVTLAEDFAWKYQRTGTFFDDMIADARKDNLITAVISCFILVVSPLVWFFSQLLYYRRREEEFYMLEAMGGFGIEIRGLHLTAGAVLSGVAFLVTLGMSYAFNFVLYMTMSRILPAFGVAQAINYNYYMPLWALALCAAVSVGCGFASCLVPYLLWKKRTEARLEKEKGGQVNGR